MADEDSPIARLRTFFLEPDTFFRNLAEQPPRYRGLLLVAFVTGIFFAVIVWLHLSFFSSISSALSPGVGPDSPGVLFVKDIILISASAIAVFGPLITAIIAGLVFYVLTGFVSRGGSLIHTITAAGWGMVPLAVYYAFSIPIFLLFRPGMTVTVAPEYFTLFNNTTSVSALEQGTMMHMITWSQSFYTYTLVNTGLAVLAWLCCAWFWIPAVQNTCHVSHRHATMIVLVPLLLFLAVSYGPGLISGGHSLQSVP